MAYPVTVTAQPLLTNRDRITTLFRFVLAIPHLILVGGAALGGTIGSSSESSSWSVGAEGGLLGAVAYFLAIISWFTIVFTGTHIATGRFVRCNMTLNRARILASRLESVPSSTN